MRPKRILVVAPHSFCESILNRDCDRAALDSVNDVKKILAHHIVDYRVSDRLRSMGDYNRMTTDNDEWRINVGNTARILNPDFIMEMHSFPGDHRLYRDIWPGANLVIFESKYNKKFVHRLRDIIKKDIGGYINILTAKPWHSVAITDQLGPTWNHTLFEFNETDDPATRKMIAESVARAVLIIIDECNRTRQYIRYIIIAAVIIMAIIFIVHVATSFGPLSLNGVYTSPHPSVFQIHSMTAKA